MNLWWFCALACHLSQLTESAIHLSLLKVFGLRNKVVVESMIFSLRGNRKSLSDRRMSEMCRTESVMSKERQVGKLEGTKCCLDTGLRGLTT